MLPQRSRLKIKLVSSIYDWMQNFICVCYYNISEVKVTFNELKTEVCAIIKSIIDNTRLVKQSLLYICIVTNSC